MTAPNNLELKGNLREHSFAELLCEISQAKLNGSLRVSSGAQKAVVYFDAGEAVFAVSNARAFRLFELVLRDEKITKQQLLAISDFTNDLILRDYLLKNDLYAKTDLDAIFVRQIEEIFRAAFEWSDGEWIFTPLVRIKADIRFEIKIENLLIEHARALSFEKLRARFENASGSFAVSSSMPVHVNLLPSEAFVFSRFEDAALTIDEINVLSGLSEDETQKIVYALWLGGFLSRRNSGAAFSIQKAAEISSAQLRLKKEEKPPVAQKAAEPKAVFAEPETEDASAEKNEDSEKEKTPSVEEISLENYLSQVENSTNLYESLNLSPETSVAEIKQNYFALAKRFHPDLFHKSEDKIERQRVQNAFSVIVQAYETLKTKSSRDVYDFRMRKELAELKKKGAAANNDAPKTAEEENLEKHNELASENFEQGFNLLMNEEYEIAIPFFARAVHFSHGNARYHAYYGKVLSSDGSQRHKAEAELQTAVRLDANNADWRLMLAEFYSEIGLMKRAEGELKRLLAIFPDNIEAKRLLDSLPQK